VRPRAILLAIALAGGACGERGDQLDLVEVRRGDLVLQAEVTGGLAAIDAVDAKAPALSASSSFKVSWLAPEGSEVAPGDRVASLDPAELERTLQAARIEIEQLGKGIEQRREKRALYERERAYTLRGAEAAARKAKLAAAISPDLTDAVSYRSLQLDDELEAMNLDEQRHNAELARQTEESDLQGAIDQRARAVQAVRDLERALTQLDVKAARAGTVVYPASGSGQKRAVGDTVYRAEPIVQVVQLGAMMGRGQVDEQAIARVAVGQPVTLRIDTLPDATLHGKVTRIAGSVVSDGPSRVVRVDLSIDPTSAALRPDMSFRGQIETARVPDAILIPAEAVFARPDGPVAYREAWRGVERVRLALGRRSADGIEVWSGVSFGDRVSRVDPEQEAP
jgi:multidrug efflux pump subunit AcrA (membrane-fusion protein)